MSHVAIEEVAPPGTSYWRHRQKQTLLYWIVDRHYPGFRDVMTAQDKPLPLHVQQDGVSFLQFPASMYKGVAFILPYFTRAPLL
jgi:hypothetical protein